MMPRGLERVSRPQHTTGEAVESRDGPMLLPQR
jgi:hypothetical protein